MQDTLIEKLRLKNSSLRVKKSKLQVQLKQVCKYMYYYKGSVLTISWSTAAPYIAMAWEKMANYNPLRATPARHIHSQ